MASEAGLEPLIWRNKNKNVMKIVDINKFIELNTAATNYVLDRLPNKGGENKSGLFKLYAVWHENKNSNSKNWIYIGITVNVLGTDYFTSSGNQHYWHAINKYSDEVYGCILSVVNEYQELLDLEKDIVSESFLLRFGEYGITPLAWNLRVGGQGGLQLYPDGKLYPCNWVKYDESTDSYVPLSTGMVTIPGLGYIDKDEYRNNILKYDSIHSTRNSEMLKLQYDEFVNFFSTRDWVVGYAEWNWYSHACITPHYMPGSIYQFLRQASHAGYDCQIIIDHLPKKWLKNSRYKKLMNYYGYTISDLKPLTKRYMYDVISSEEGLYLSFAWDAMYHHGFRFGKRPKTNKYHKDHKPRVYISAGWFSEAQEEARLVVKSVLDELGVDYFSPKDDVLVTNDSTKEEKDNALLKDIEEISGCDFMIASTEGKDPGTLWECGAAYELGTPVIYYFPHPDWNFNLMLAKTGKHVSFTREDLLATIKLLLDSKLDFSLLEPYTGNIE